MRLGVYSIFDTAVMAYLPPFYARTMAEAIRSFRAAALDPSHMVGMSRKDYGLVHLGTFDDNTGSFEQEAAPVPVMNAEQAAAFMNVEPETDADAKRDEPLVQPGAERGDPEE